MYLGICTWAYVCRHMYVGICTWAYVCRHMYVGICMRVYYRYIQNDNQDLPPYDDLIHVWCVSGPVIIYDSTGPDVQTIISGRHYCCPMIISGRSPPCSYISVFTITVPSSGCWAATVTGCASHPKPGELPNCMLSTNVCPEYVL